MPKNEYKKELKEDIRALQSRIGIILKDRETKFYPIYLYNTMIIVDVGDIQKKWNDLLPDGHHRKKKDWYMSSQPNK